MFLQKQTYLYLKQEDKFIYYLLFIFFIIEKFIKYILLYTLSLIKMKKETVTDNSGYITKCDDLKQFESGASRDNPEGKGAYELISPLALKRLALVYERGAKQKGDRNWEKGFPMSRCIQSALRHIEQYLEGLRDEDHLAAASWNLFAAIHFEEQIKRGNLPENLNDLPNYVYKP